MCSWCFRSWCEVGMTGGSLDLHYCFFLALLLCCKSSSSLAATVAKGMAAAVALSFHCNISWFWRETLPFLPFLHSFANGCWNSEVVFPSVGWTKPGGNGLIKHAAEFWELCVHGHGWWWSLHPDATNQSIRSIDSFFNPQWAGLIFAPFLCCSGAVCLGEPL